MTMADILTLDHWSLSMNDREWKKWIKQLKAEKRQSENHDRQITRFANRVFDRLEKTLVRAVRARQK